MNTEELLFEAIGNNIEGSTKGQLFGKPCYKIGKKAYVCFFQNEMVFKLKGENHADALSLDGSQLFDPSGKKRPMKEWVQVPYEYAEQWETFAKQAFTYVGNLK